MTSAKFIDMTATSSQMDEGNQPTIDKLEEIDIEMPGDPRPIFVSKHLSEQSKNTKISFS